MPDQIDLTQGAQRRMGEWEWQPVRVSSRPEGACVSQQLRWWKWVDGEADVMHCILPHTMDAISEDQLREFAKAPDSREFDVDGERWIAFALQDNTFVLRRSNPPPPQSIPGHVCQISNRGLGELTLSELQDLVRSHR